MLKAAEFFAPDEHPYALTTQDVSIATRNAVAVKSYEAADADERGVYDELQREIGGLRLKMDADERTPSGYAPGDSERLLALITRRDDFIAMLQRKYKIRVPKSRSEVDVTPTDGFGNIPFGFANMLRVTGVRMAIRAAQMGGWAAFPQGKSPADVDDFFRKVQGHHTFYQTPPAVLPTTMVRDAAYYMQKYPVDHVVVTDERRHLLGLIQDDDLRMAEELDPEMQVGSLPLNRDVVTVPEGTSLGEAIRIMRSERIHFLPIVSNVAKTEQQIRWVLTLKGAEQAQQARPHLDQDGRLATVLAISAQRDGWKERVDQAVAAGVTGLILDSPRFDLGHGGQIDEEELFAALLVIAEREGSALEPDRIRRLMTQMQIGELPPLTAEEWRDRVAFAAERIVASKRKTRLIVGNVDDPAIVESIVAAAVKAGMKAEDVIIKVGIGPGHACTTRVVEGVGVPQFSVAYETARAARRLGAFVWADGGIRTPGELSRLLAAGASQGMIGTIAAPLIESPALLHHDADGVYAVNFGMASEAFAMLRQDVPQDRERIRRTGTYAEGLKRQRVYQQPGIADVGDFTLANRRGIEGTSTMVGAFTMAELRKYVAFVLQHETGHAEGLGKLTVR